MWTRFVVYGVKVEVTFNNVTGTTPFVVGIYADPNTTDGTTSAVTNMLTEEDVWNSPYVTRRTICNAFPGNGSQKRLKFYIPINKLIGCTKAKITSDDNYSGTFNDNPNIQPAIGVFAVRRIPSGSTFAGVAALIRVTYYTRWMEAVRFHNQGAF